MSAASARAALIDLASSWRAQGMIATQVGNTRAALVYAACAERLDEATITHLSSSVTTDQQYCWTQFERTASALRTVDAFIAVMAMEGVPAGLAERVVNVVLHGHPDGAEAARITGRTTESPDDLCSNCSHPRICHQPDPDSKWQPQHGDACVSCMNCPLFAPERANGCASTPPERPGQ